MPSRDNLPVEKPQESCITKNPYWDKKVMRICNAKTRIGKTKTKHFQKTTNTHTHTTAASQAASQAPAGDNRQRYELRAVGLELQ